MALASKDAGGSKRSLKDGTTIAQIATPFSENNHE